MDGCSDFLSEILSEFGFPSQLGDLSETLRGARSNEISSTESEQRENEEFIIW